MGTSIKKLYWYGKEGIPKLKCLSSAYKYLDLFYNLELFIDIGFRILGKTGVLSFYKLEGGAKIKVIEI